MSFEETLKKYFETLIESDNAIKAVYSEEKITNCASYIFKMARKESKKNCAVIEDTKVYKWARDFYLGDIDEADKDETISSDEVEVMQSEQKEEPAEVKKPAKKAPKVQEIDMTKGQLNLFDFGD